MKLRIRDLFFSPWKPPLLTNPELEFEKQKEIQKKGLSQLESRLESIELLLTSDKWEDAKLLFHQLTYDLVNFQLQRTGQKEIPFGANLSSFSIPESDRKSKPFRFLEFSDKLSELKNTELDKILTFAIDTYEFLLEESNKEFKSRLMTTLDSFRLIKRIRILLVSLVFTFSFVSFFYYQYKYPVMKDQSIKLYTFVSKENQQTSESRVVSLPVLKKDIGNWVEYEFPLDESMSSFGGLRIDPLEQRGIRFVLDQISIWDSKGKEIYSKRIIVSPNLLPEDYQDFLKIVDVKTASKQMPGEIVEMITTGSDPQIQLVFATLNDAKIIKLKMKYIEAHKVKKK
ncbi:hypothetical protein [Leptospira perdikensis]|uniref:hypothetical protein n=1 Tax=Leptospira perdikensis TaxID=2484948 RepID=UPI003134603E